MADGGAKPPAKMADNVSICQFIGQLCCEYRFERCPCRQKTQVLLVCFFSPYRNTQSPKAKVVRTVCVSVCFACIWKTNLLNIRLLYSLDLKYASAFQTLLDEDLGRNQPLCQGKVSASYALSVSVVRAACVDACQSQNSKRCVCVVLIVSRSKSSVCLTNRNHSISKSMDSTSPLSQGPRYKVPSLTRQQD